jgi:hypothetical protein
MYSPDPEKQEELLSQKFLKLIQVLVVHDIPFTFLDFPRFVNDPKYLFHKLEFFLTGITYDQFLAAYRISARSDWVHSFDL